MTRRRPRSTLFPYTTLFRSELRHAGLRDGRHLRQQRAARAQRGDDGAQAPLADVRSEEHTSELQSRRDLVCRLLLDKKNKLYVKGFLEYEYTATQLSPTIPG